MTLSALLAAVLLTPPGPGLTGTIISTTTVGDTDYVVREITIPPGQSTGWHWHTGKLYGTVKQGMLTHYDATCKPDGVYPAGTGIQEASGTGYVHLGANHGRTPLILQVLYVLPTGSPLSVDAPNPGCEFQ